MQILPVGILAAFLCAVTGFTQSPNPVNVVVWGDSVRQSDIPPDLTNAVAVAAGMTHFLALKADGTVRAWGNNGEWQCDVPPDLTNAAAISAGDYFSAALLKNGSVVAWGYFFGPRFVVPGVTNPISISCGGDDMVILRSDHSVLQVGFVMTGGSGDWEYYRWEIGAMTNITTALDVGYHQLAIRADGTVATWGNAYYGLDHVPAELTNTVAIGGGLWHNLAIQQDGKIVAWGSNERGEGAVPDGLTNAIAVYGGYYCSLARTADGRVITWGDTTNGSCRLPENLPPVKALSIGAGTGIALLDFKSSFDLCFTPTVVLKSPPGSVCQIEYRDSVGPEDAWQSLAFVLVTNYPQLYFDVSALGQPKRFYRIK